MYSTCTCTCMYNNVTIHIITHLDVSTCLRAFLACPRIAVASCNGLIPLLLSGTWSSLSDSLRNFLTGFLAAGKTITRH